MELTNDLLRSISRVLNSGKVKDPDGLIETLAEVLLVTVEDLNKALTSVFTPKFKVGELVLYQNGDSFELGIVKSIREVPDFPSNAEQGFIYYVWYHMGDTAAATPEDTLHKLKNEYAFLVVRRMADTSSIDDTAARDLACSILNKLDSMTLEKYSQPLFDDYEDAGGESCDEPVVEGLVTGAYYDMEDAITELINDYKN